MKPAAESRTPKPARRQPAVGAVAVKGHAPAFREIIGLIQFARQEANRPERGIYAASTRWRPQVGRFIPVRSDGEAA